MSLEADDIQDSNRSLFIQHQLLNTSFTQHRFIFTDNSQNRTHYALSEASITTTIKMFCKKVAFTAAALCVGFAVAISTTVVPDIATDACRLYLNIRTEISRYLDLYSPFCSPLLTKISNRLCL